MRRGILAGMAALLLLSAPALAEGRTRSYGGSGADRLTRLIEYGDGVIAVGRTDSRNGDLEMRTRSNQAGWMLCLNGEGAPLWSYCTAKDGRNEMSAPFAHENRQISAVLTGRGIDGLEWLLVGSEGKLAQRRTAPAAGEACAHGGAAMVGMPYDRDGAPHLALIVDHGDDTCCVADLDLDGQVTRGASFAKGAVDLAPCLDGSGRLVSADCENGEAGILLVTPGTEDAPTRVALSGAAADEVTAVLPLEDGSTVAAGRSGGGGFLALGGSAVRVAAHGGAHLGADVLRGRRALVDRAVAGARVRVALHGLVAHAGIAGLGVVLRLGRFGHHRAAGCLARQDVLLRGGIG